jgi:hypothetical protein
MIKPVLNIFCVVALVAVMSTSTSAQAVTLFAGVPIVKISEGGVDRVVEQVPRQPP